MALKAHPFILGARNLSLTKDGAFSYPVAPEERNSFLQCHIEKDSFIVSEKSVRPGNTIETIYLQQKIGLCGMDDCRAYAGLLRDAGTD